MEQTLEKRIESLLKRIEENPVLKSQFDELLSFIDSQREESGVLINVLHKAQSIFGYLPDEVLDFVSSKLNIPLSKIYGVVTFYHFFSRTPKGRHVINVCLGTACYVRGGKAIYLKINKLLGIKAGETTEDQKFSIDIVRCIGACGLAPTIVVGKDVYGRVKPSNLEKILEKYE